MRMFALLARLFQIEAAAPVKLHASEICSACGSRLAQRNSSEWLCPNPDCPPEVLKRVITWAEAMELPGCDAALVAQLVQRGLVRDAAEYYRLKLGELESLEGLGAARAREVWDGIQASRKREAWRALAGMGIPHLGPREAQLLCSQFSSLEEVFAAGPDRLLKLPGVTEVMARELTYWHGDAVNRRLLRRLRKAGVNFQCRTP